MYSGGESTECPVLGRCIAKQVERFASLGPQERACVVLRYYADRTVPEIAAELHLAEGTVKRYLSNALHRLRARLGEVDGGVPGVPGGPDGPDHVDVLPEGRA